MTEDEIKSVVNTLLDKDIDTVKFYFAEYSILGEERQELHAQIIADILNREFWPSTKKVYFLGGAPANGKSTFLKQNPDKCPSDVLRIDPDEIKRMLPEYNYMVRHQILDAASRVHEESSSIAKQLRRRAIEAGHDLVIDAVSDDSIEKRREVYQVFKNSSYYIIMHYVTLDALLSLELAEKRAAETGREVPLPFIRDMNKVIARLIPQLIDKQLFDELYLWDTNDPENTHLILRQINVNLEIVRIDLYEKFKMKGYEENERKS